MGSTRKPHVVLVPFPAHGHVAPHMQLARVLHARGVHVTLVHTELHHRRLLRAKGGSAAASQAVPGFGVEVIPDGLSLEDPPRTLEAHHKAMERNCLEPFKALLRALRDRPGVPPVSCVEWWPTRRCRSRRWRRGRSASRTSSSSPRPRAG